MTMRFFGASAIIRGRVADTISFRRRTCVATGSNRPGWSRYYDKMSADFVA